MPSSVASGMKGITSSAAVSAGALEIDPSTKLHFNLGTYDTYSQVTITLKHPGGGITDSLAFKVKTRQPRRYLVRPNKGLIAPGGVETVQILLAEKDKKAFLQTYQGLGQTGVVKTKDRLLLLSCQVTTKFSQEYASAGDKGYDKLSNMWDVVTANPSFTGSAEAPNSSSVVNKKLRVRYIVSEGPVDGSCAAVSTKGGGGPETMSNLPQDPMTSDQLTQEVANKKSHVGHIFSEGAVDDTCTAVPTQGGGVPRTTSNFPQEPLAGDQLTQEVANEKLHMHHVISVFAVDASGAAISNEGGATGTTYQLTQEVASKKLHLRHVVSVFVVDVSVAALSNTLASSRTTPNLPQETMTGDQLTQEVANKKCHMLHVVSQGAVDGSGAAVTNKGGATTANVPKETVANGQLTQELIALNQIMPRSQSLLSPPSPVVSRKRKCASKSDLKLPVSTQLRGNNHDKHSSPRKISM